MSTEANQDLVRRLVAGINQRNFDVVEDIFAEGFVDHSQAPGMPPTREGFKQALSMFIAAFPDLTLREEDLIAEGDNVVYRGSFTGTLQGNFIGTPASERQVTCSEIHIVRCANGRIVEHWQAIDTLGLLQQLGAIRPRSSDPRPRGEQQRSVGFPRFSPRPATTGESLRRPLPFAR